MPYRRLLLALFALAPLAFPGAAAGDDGDVIRLGISHYATPNPNEELYDKSIETLRLVVAPKKLSVKFYSPGELDRMEERDRLHLVFGSAGFYRRTALATGSRELLSIAGPLYPNPNGSDGSAIVVRSDRTDLVEISSLKGRTLSANARFTFTGFIVPMGEVAALGEDPEKFFSRIDFKGEGATMPLVARDVIEGRADAGFLRLCMLENLERRGVIPRGALRVLGDRTQTGEPCRRSTPLYPGWTVSSTPRADSNLVRRITLALLAMPPTEKGLHWAVATNYQSVDRLYKSLRMGPYEYLREWTVERLIEHYWKEVAWLLAAMAVLTLAALFWGTVAKRREIELKAAYGRERALERKVRESAERMEALQRVWAVGELSSTIAHELRQPLASIQLMGRGLMRCMENGTLSEETVKSAVGTIDEAAKRAEGIVRKVRSYAKSPVSAKTPFNFREAVERGVGFSSVARSHPRCLLETDLADARVTGDPVELTLAAANLIKNAAEACERQPDPCVRVELRAGQRATVLSVADNGPGLSDEQFRRLGEPLRTSKEHGTGLGLAIVRAIAESHGGRIEFERGKDSGLTVRMVLPSAENETERKNV